MVLSWFALHVISDTNVASRSQDLKKRVVCSGINIRRKVDGGTSNCLKPVDFTSFHQRGLKWTEMKSTSFKTMKNETAFKTRE